MILEAYDRLLTVRDDPIVRLNRAVALSRVTGPAAALAALQALEGPRLAAFPPYQAAHADFLAWSGCHEEARAAYAAVLARGVPEAERRWLIRQQRRLDDQPAARWRST